MNELRTVRCALALATALGFAAACGGGKKPEAAAPKAAPQKIAKAEAAAPSTAPYHYDPTDKVDPFKSYIKRQVTLDSAAETSPLERFDLSQLTVMGIVWGVEEPRALVRDPTGKGYIVRTGTPIGKNKGRIVRIEDNKVVVKETYLDHLDRATTKEVELELYANGRKDGA